MKKMKAMEIIRAARDTADNAICCYSGGNAERILKLAWEKVRAKNTLLRVKYDEQEKRTDRRRKT